MRVWNAAAPGLALCYMQKQGVPILQFNKESYRPNAPAPPSAADDLDIAVRSDVSVADPEVPGMDPLDGTSLARESAYLEQV